MKNNRRERARRLLPSDRQLAIDFYTAKPRERRKLLAQVEADERDKATPRPGTDDARHVAHCCANHGCAYDHDDCPVEALRLRQRSACGAASPCERTRPVRLPPRPLQAVPLPPVGDPRVQHLTGGAKR